ncbi:SDR family oxidoreductase [Halioglobus maricola]|uniref:SDR family oxidoreductase n=1 Tax=Halioglobus maricola TaxID=2601894 RepID=A0A5P9NS77_9GAMM|nr:SDR family oxidoreductase [Halioglobus maricola]
MNILVTGHRGYIGTCLVPRLTARGFNVTGCDSDLYAGCDFGPLPDAIPAFDCDYRDLSIEQLAPFDAIVHLAGLSNDPLGELDPALTDDINHRGAVGLARKARDAGVQRFIFSSSCSTYGAAGEAFIDESGAFHPVTAYGRSKVDAERGIAKLASDYFSPSFLRNATVYGYSPRMRFDLVVNNLVAWAYTSGRVLLKSRGTAWRPLVHVADVADAFIATLDAPRAAVHLKALNIGRSSENFRVCEVADMVARSVPDSRTDMVPEATADARNYRVNCDLATSVLTTWKPRWTVPDGIEEVYRACIEFGLSADEFESPKLQRLAHLQLRLQTGELQADLRPSKVAGEC